MMKKFLIGLLSILMLFCVGCSPTSDDSNSTGGSSSESSTETYYSVVFTQNGTSVTKNVKAGESLTDIPTIVESKTGYMVKWSVEDFSCISSDLNVTLIFEPIKSVIHYDLGECPNAVITALTQTVTYDESFNLYIPQPYMSAEYEYEFVKWVVKSTQTEFVNGVCDFTVDVELVAVWEKFTPSFPI